MQLLQSSYHQYLHCAYKETEAQTGLTPPQATELTNKWRRQFKSEIQ